MIKIPVLLILSFLFSSFASNTGNYYYLYDSFNSFSNSALAYNTGAYFFDFLPLDPDNIDDDFRFAVSSSVFVRQPGGRYGRTVKNGEDVDLLKSFSAIWNHQTEFMPYISYHTPYKSVLNRNEQAEFKKMREAVSLGIISDLEGHQILMGVDGVFSSFKVTESDPVSERIMRRGGFSARIYMNKKMNPRSSMFAGLISPVFWEYAYGDHNVPADQRYFQMFSSLGGFNYKKDNYFAAYVFTYKNFRKIYDSDDGRQLTYPWVMEHNIILGYRIDKNIRFSVDYQLTPSVFTRHMPHIGDIYRHTVGGFAGVDIGNLTLNFRYADSKMFSPVSAGSIYFQMDMIYHYR